MKPAVQVVRVLVGLLFIFSGLVKANDPLGLSYKMQEYFEIWGTHQFNSYSLLASLLMNAFEIIAGFALLIGWRIRLFIWLLLLLIIVFTFFDRLYFLHRLSQKLRLLRRLPAHQFQNLLPERCGAAIVNRVSFMETTSYQTNIQ